MDLELSPPSTRGECANNSTSGVASRGSLTGMRLMMKVYPPHEATICSTSIRVHPGHASIIAIVIAIVIATARSRNAVMVPKCPRDFYQRNLVLVAVLQAVGQQLG